MSSSRDLLGLGAIFVSNILVNKSGIGGGGIMIPILLIILQLDSVQAVALSNLAVLAGAATNFYSNVNKRHPNPQLNRPLVDWNIIMIMEPSTMLTAVLGAYLGHLLPKIVLVFLLTLVLGVVAIRTFFTGMKQYHAEEALIINEIRKEKGSYMSFNILSQTYQQVSNIALSQEFSWSLPEISFGSFYASNRQDENRLNKILEEESYIPYVDLFALIGLTLTVVLLTLMKANMSCGGVWYLTDLLFIVIIVVAFAIYYRYVILIRWIKKIEAGYVPVEGDVEWTEENSIRYPLLCSFAGLLAGVFGVGGGLLKGPLMLELGVLPTVASATSNVMILFTSAAATSSFLILGNLNGVYNYAIIIFALSICGTLLGQLLIQIKRPSFITLLIGSTVLVSAIMLVSELIDQLDGETWSQIWKIGTICPSIDSATRHEFSD